MNPLEPTNTQVPAQTNERTNEHTTARLTCDFLGWQLHSPLVLASGIMVALDWGGGLINAIGLTNPGAEHEAALLAETRQRLAPLGVPLIASIFAGTVEEFGQVAAVVAQAQPDLIEVNISCPNVGDEFGTPFAGTPESAAAVTDAVARALARSGDWEPSRRDRPERAALPLPLGEGWGEGRIPISVKLAPNVPDIARIARAVVEAGADAITAVNTMPGMVIDAASGRPVLSNQVGGVSGPALKPIALRAVFEIAQATAGVPIIGTGGVTTGVDAAEMLMAGATVVGVGSAVWYRGVDAFGQINAELAAFMAQHGYPSVASLRRVALHESDRIKVIDRMRGVPQSCQSC